MSTHDTEAVVKLQRDVREAVAGMSTNHVRFLVDAYYQLQDSRIRNNAQATALNSEGEPSGVIYWLADQHKVLEKELQKALDTYSAASPLGTWARSVIGIGPVIASGFLAHIDINRAPTVGHIWRFAGLDPTCVWKKGERRPWNAALKTLCWKTGESFVKVSNREDAFYGQLYKKRKALETARNDAGEFAVQAEAALSTGNFKKDTMTKKHYENGRLPPARIHARARRYAVKIFLAHYHEQAYRLVLGKEPPLPYPIAHQGHVHKIGVPISVNP